MSSPLENLVKAGRSLSAEPPDRKEFDRLVRMGRVRLTDAANPTLGIESRFDLAYNASLSLALAALRRTGYRAKERYIVFQVLPHTLGLGPEVWRVLDKAHAHRNLAEYRGDIGVEPALVDAVIVAAGKVLDALDRLPPP